MRGFIDDVRGGFIAEILGWSQSAFMRGFIDDASLRLASALRDVSQSAFMRGFIDDTNAEGGRVPSIVVSIRVHARLHR